jgi:hypothetical protein
VRLGAYLAASYLLSFAVTIQIARNWAEAIGMALGPWAIAGVVAAVQYRRGGKRPLWFQTAWIVLAIILALIIVGTLDLAY